MRISLTEEEVRIILDALNEAQKNGVLNYSVITVGRRAMQNLINRLTSRRELEELKGGKD